MPASPDALLKRKVEVMRTGERPARSSPTLRRMVAAGAEEELKFARGCALLRMARAVRMNA